MQDWCLNNSSFVSMSKSRFKLIYTPYKNGLFHMIGLINLMLKCCIYSSFSSLNTSILGYSSPLRVINNADQKVNG